MKKRALVLGTGSAQVDLIRYLKDEGWWVLGCSYRQEGKGLQYLDRFEQVNITDIPGVESLARTAGVDLVYSIGSDLAMPTIGAVSASLGLPVLANYATASLLQNKVQLREFLTERNISPVKHRMIRGKSDLDGWSGFPAIAKPADNQGQRGVFLAKNVEELADGLEKALEQSRSGTVIVEEYLDGPEISVNAFVLEGDLPFCEVSDRLVVESYAGGIPESHVLPARSCTGNMLSQAKELVKSCVQALGIENGPVYFQMKLTAQGPKVIEITPRLDGCHIWRLIKTVGKVDLLDSSIKLLSGETSLELEMCGDLPGAHLNFLFSLPGVEFRTADHPAPADVCHLEYYYEDGELVRPINGYYEKVGYYIQQGN